MFPRLDRRDRQAELMDDPGVCPRAHRQALAGLARVNALSRTAAIFWHALEQRWRTPPNRALTILDVACGGGDVALGLARIARRKGWPVEITGVDISETALQRAQEAATAARLPLRLIQQDVLHTAWPGRFDVVCTSLFLHHLSEADALLLLRQAKAAANLLLISDLDRTRLGYGLAWFGCRLLSRSPIVHYDGPVSVQAAFTAAEARALAAEAGLADATVTRTWPERWLLRWQAPAPDIVAPAEATPSEVRP